MSLKVAIVGCGKIADGHVEEIQKMPELARVVAACDLEPLMAEQLAARYGIARHGADFDRLLAEEKPDVVHITTPPSSHLPLALKAIAAGCHVYVEKPFTLAHADSKKLVAAAEAAGKKLSIGYTYLFDPPALEMRALLREGVLGDVVHVESFFGYNLDGPFGKAILGDPNHWVSRLPGQLFHNNIDHLLNKAVEFLGDDEDAPPLSAFGSVRRAARFGDDRDKMMDELRVVLRGKRTTIYGTFSSHVRPAAHFVRVYGTRNTAHVDYVMRTVTLDAAPTLPSAIGRLVPAFAQAARFAKAGGQNVLRFAKSDFHFFSGLNHLFRAYYRSIIDNGPPPISHRDILRVSAMLDEIFSQLDAQRRGLS
ncbi:MAG: Gfo/Idh/MocA family oxidoreductase [Polyangiaceae bacterium]|jgi:predicted dehydrogenase|nr:Gfo/Idh/MocA family oxidoreductase [Polyangiaceae bacterium]